MRRGARVPRITACQIKVYGSKRAVPRNRGINGRIDSPEYAEEFHIVVVRSVNDPKDRRTAVTAATLHIACYGLAKEHAVTGQRSVYTSVGNLPAGPARGSPDLVNYFSFRCVTLSNYAKSRAVVYIDTPQGRRFRYLIPFDDRET